MIKISETDVESWLSGLENRASRSNANKPDFSRLSMTSFSFSPTYGEISCNVLREISPLSALDTFRINSTIVSSYVSEIQLSPPSIPAILRTFTDVTT